MHQGFPTVKLKSSPQKYDGRHHDLVISDEISVFDTIDHEYVQLVGVTIPSCPLS